MEHNENQGYCVICEEDTIFVKQSEWLRDNYLCQKCKSISTQRALINALNKFVDDWHLCDIYESSPCGVASDYQGYGLRCENLEQLSFDDNCFDVVIKQDVFEHIFNPEKAFREIARVLEPGGKHIFTVPWYKNLDESMIRAKIENDKIQHLVNPVYHGNPVDCEGALVTRDWGRDICDVIYKSSGMTTLIWLNEDEKLGLEADFLEVFISRKPKKALKLRQSRRRMIDECIKNIG